MVEAAGVEPASEKARHEKPTCVADSVFVGGHIRTSEERDRLARLISALGLRAEAFQPILRDDVH
jgi:hypothetical protein